MAEARKLPKLPVTVDISRSSSRRRDLTGSEPVATYFDSSALVGVLLQGRRSERRDVAVCELMLVEFALKLRNARIFTDPLSAAQATAVCRQYRKNRAWMLIESAPVMEEVWQLAATSTSGLTAAG